MKDLTGKTFNYWTVLNPTVKNNRPAWFCRCRCGNYQIIEHGNLIYGRTKSCGCWMKEFNSKLFTTHGMSRTVEYKTWKAIRGRCKNPNDQAYPDYGGRGITVCERWDNSFEAFYEDMGKRPPGMSLERIDNDKGYCKENCRWATQKEQCNNRRSSRFLTHNGKTQTMTRWSEEMAIKVKTIHRRLALGWTVSDALKK